MNRRGFLSGALAVGLSTAFEPLAAIECAPAVIGIDLSNGRMPASKAAQ